MCNVMMGLRRRSKTCTPTVPTMTLTFFLLYVQKNTRCSAPIAENADLRSAVNSRSNTSADERSWSSKRLSSIVAAGGDDDLEHLHGDAAAAAAAAAAAGGGADADDDADADAVNFSTRQCCDPSSLLS